MHIDTGNVIQGTSLPTFTRFNGPGWQKKLWNARIPYHQISGDVFQVAASTVVNEFDSGEHQQ